MALLVLKRESIAGTVRACLNGCNLEEFHPCRQSAWCQDIQVILGAFPFPNAPRPAQDLRVVPGFHRNLTCDIFWRRGKHSNQNPLGAKWNSSTRQSSAIRCRSGLPARSEETPCLIEGNFIFKAAGILVICVCLPGTVWKFKNCNGIVELFLLIPFLSRLMDG